MRRSAIGMIITALVLALLLSGCGGNTVEFKLVSTPTLTEAQAPTGLAAPDSTATATPEIQESVTTAPNATVTLQPTVKPPETKPEVYVIEGSSLYRQTEEGDILVYDAAAYFEKGWNCSLGHLLAEDDALYFTETGGPGDDFEDSVHRIICVDSIGRTVLDEKSAIGYTQLVSYGSRIFFVQDGFDSQEIGWANKDGSASAYMDFSQYAQQYSVEPYYNGATIFMDNGVLYADIAFFTDADPEIADHTVSISKDLEITRVK